MYSRVVIHILIRSEWEFLSQPSPVSGIVIFLHFSYLVTCIVLSILASLLMTLNTFLLVLRFLLFSGLFLTDWLEFLAYYTCKLFGYRFCRYLPFLVCLFSLSFVFWWTEVLNFYVRFIKLSLFDLCFLYLKKLFYSPKWWWYFLSSFPKAL